MEPFLFDSFLSQYKSPFGAVPTDTSVRLCIDIHQKTYVAEVLCVYHCDQQEPFFKNMIVTDGAPTEYIRYQTEISFSVPNIYFYRFCIRYTNGDLVTLGRVGTAATANTQSEWQLTVYDKSFQVPKWTKGAVMYQIFPDRFARSHGYTPPPAKNERTWHENWYDTPDFIYNNPQYKGNDFFGGNLEGIREQIPYLKHLGIDVIYLNPIFESPENHRYSTADYTQVDPYLGNNHQFTNLCNACSSANIRIILDGVFSHTGADSVYFNKYNHYPSCGAYQNPQSPYYHWYTFDNSPIGYACWWGFESLPNVTEIDPDYLNFITGKNGILSLWQNRGAKGWRLDVADELPDLFLQALRKRIKATDPEALIIGEVWEDATNKVSYGSLRRYLLGEQLDSVMNYPWRTAIIDYIKEENAEKFCQRIRDLCENYPAPALQCAMNSLSTHDTPRIINVFGVQREVPHENAANDTLTPEEYERGKQGFIAASFLQFTLPGIPCIYYGDEVGLTGYADPYCRKTYPFGREDIQLFDHFRRLIAFRKKYIHDFSSPIENLFSQNRTVCFSRGNLFFAINRGNTDEIIPFRFQFVTLFGKATVDFTKKTLTVPAKQFAILGSL